MAVGPLVRDSVISLRLFSAVAVAGALGLMFAVLRRAYGVLPSILALTVTFLHPDLLNQSEQARLHALFLAELGFAVLIYQMILARRSVSLHLLASNAIVHGAMIMTSYIALFYSAAILSALLVTCLVRRRNPLRPCASIVLAWVLLIPWIPVLLTHIEMSKLGWIPVPSPVILRTYFEGYLTREFRFFIRIAVIFAVLAMIATLIWGGRRRLEGFRRREISSVALAAALLAVPFVLYFFSLRSGGTSIFHERYLLGTLLGWSVLLAHITHRAFLMRHRHGLPLLTLALISAQVIVTLVFVGDHVRRMIKIARHLPAQEVPADLATDLPGNDPIVIEHIHEFLSWHFYLPHRGRYRFLLDSEVASKEMAGGPLNHAIMSALKRRLPTQFNEVVRSEEFLATASASYVRHSPGYQWSPMRLQQDPAFEIESLPDNLQYARRKSP